MWLFCAIGLLLATLAAPAAANPDGVAVIVGNRGYQGRVPQVDYAHRDADAFRAYVLDTLEFRPENVIDLRDAGQAQLFSVFGNANDHRGKLWSLVRPDRSDVVVYYSGHGVPGQRDRRGYLLPVDADAETPEINGYALDVLYGNLAKLRARQVTVFIDACFSGDSQAGTLIQSASPVHLRARPATVPPALVVLTAAQADQLASWDTAAGQGLFTRHLLRALSGTADRAPWGDGDGRVSLAETQAYLDDEMSYAARRLYRREQRASVVGPAQTVLAAVVAQPTAPPPAAKPAAPARPAPPAPSAPDDRAELLFWESVRDSSNPADLEAYLARYPQGTFAVLARNRLAGLRPPAPAPAPTATPAAPKQSARLPGHDGSWVSEDGNSTLEVRGGSGEFRFYYGGSTWRATLTIEPDGRISNGYVNFNAFSGAQFRGTMPNVTYEIFGTGYGKGTVHLRRRDDS